MVTGAEADREFVAVSVVRINAAAKGLVGIIGEARDFAGVITRITRRNRAAADRGSRDGGGETGIVVRDRARIE